MRAFLNNLWNLRRSPRRIVRIVWWGVLLCLIALTVQSKVLRAFWMTANVLLVLAAAGWGLFHPRAILRARHVALRWAFWLALLATLFGFSFLRTYLAETVGIAFSSSLTLFVTGVVFCVLFVNLLAIGFIGASIGAFVGRRQSDADSAARVGTGAWWLTALLVWLVAGLFPSEIAQSMVAPVLMSGIPVLTVWISALTQQPTYSPQHVARRILNWLARRLVWRWRRKGKVRTFDFRGTTLGLVAAAFALLVAATHWLLPMQTWVLVLLIQFRNEPLSSQVPASFRWFEERRTLAPRERIVLLEMDTPIRRYALTQRSEAAVQAELIRRLSAWGAQRIVLPLPLLDADWQTDTVLRPDIPQPTQAAVERSTKDLPKLIQTMRSTNRVVLAVPQFPVFRQFLGFMHNPNRRQPSFRIAPSVRADVDRLMKVAHGVGSADLESYGSVYLPVMRTEWEPQQPTFAPYSRALPPIPILLFAAAQRREPTVRPVPNHTDRVEIAGKRVSLIAPGKVLVDFIGSEPGRDFSRVSYTSVLRGESLYVEPIIQDPFEKKAQGKWLTPKQYFKGKMVFLDSLSQRTRETPIGTMPQMEALANATATLLSGSHVRRPSPLDVVLWVLLISGMVGHLCNRREPLAAGWRAGVAAFIVLGVTAMTFLGGTWMDPVVPLVAIVSSYLLVTQFTFAMQERERTLLQRFAAPQVVEKLLEEADWGLGGKRQRVCVLFADVREFTQFAEGHTPEQVIEVINTYMTALTEALFAQGGILDKYTGDGLMAFFPVTTSPREDIARAVRAALDMRNAAESISARLVAQGQQPLHVGIGMNYGEAVVGLVGNPNRWDYTALGYTVVVSQRLQSLAAGGEVIISDTVYAAISDVFQTEECQPVRVKGVSAPVRPYRLAIDGKVRPLIEFDIKETPTKDTKGREEKEIRQD